MRTMATALTAVRRRLANVSRQSNSRPRLRRDRGSERIEQQKAAGSNDQIGRKVPGVERIEQPGDDPGEHDQPEAVDHRFPVNLVDPVAHAARDAERRIARFYRRGWSSGQTCEATIPSAITIASSEKGIAIMCGCRSAKSIEKYGNSLTVPPMTRVGVQ